MTNSPTLAPRSYDSLLTELLDKGYARLVRPVVQAIEKDAYRGIIAQRLTELDTEAARLQGMGQKLQPDNPVFRALLADMDGVLKQQALLIDNAAPKLQDQGFIAGEKWFEQTTFEGMTPAQLEAMGFSFNKVDPETLRSMADYTTSPEWRQSINGYSDSVLDTLQNQVIRGYVMGQHPRATANQIRQTIPTLTRWQAENMMRTVQLQSYRNANAVHQRQNAEILDHQIRIATLDKRCCLACIALHGKKYPVGEVIKDHHAGRCTSIAVVKGRQYNIQSGEEWFNNQPIAVQREIAGKGNLAALQSGRVKLADFVGHYDDKIYGRLPRQASLSSILNSKTERELAALNRFESADKGQLTAADYKTYTGEAKRLTANQLETGDDDPDNPLVKNMWDMFGYDDNGNATYLKEAVEQKHSDLLYDTYRIGRDYPKPSDIERARVESAALIIAYQEAGITISRAQMNQLQRMAEGDVIAEINKIKDNRAVGRSGGGSGRKSNKFQTAAGADGAATFFEQRMSGYVSGINDRGVTLEINLDV